MKPTRPTTEHNPAGEFDAHDPGVLSGVVTETFKVFVSPAPGRKCWTCRKHQAYSEFIYSNVGAGNRDAGTKRVCRTCYTLRRTRTYPAHCVMCEKDFESSSQRAILCSEACRLARINENRQARADRPPEPKP